jgi:hypothetical protein
MNIHPTALGLALLVCATGGIVQAQPASNEASKSAADACENAVAETVRTMRGRQAQEVEFVAARRAIAPGTGEEIGIKGEGRYRGASERAMPFSYSCAFNPSTGTTNGVVFKETGAARAAAEKPWQPDLTHLSPEACETAAAAALKDKYPHASRIAFRSDSLQLRPAPDARTSLEGRGGLERAPGMNPMPFSYRCEVETKSGKVISVQTGD